MPLIRVQLSVPIEKDKQSKLMASLSQSVAQTLGKPESYMMVVLEPDTPMLMSAKAEPTALVEVRSVGTISGDQAKNLSNTISQTINQEVDINVGRIYSNFMGVPGAMWGYNGGTFG